ncbi:hypothetical protein DL98DRAFT_425086 [Cadophora sp. DSE1049]|nr:hypothetical protein DL98DRAFT_425086 [Cadophora sp. DSE1049]
MKILCLHGILTSSAVFEFQTAPFRKLLGEDYEYVFIDGKIEVETSSPDSAAQFRWTRNAGPPEIRSAHEYIETVIEEEGPFEGVMGFSDGAATAASILLQHEINKSDKPSPFHFAILFSCPLVSSPDTSFEKAFYESSYNMSSTEMFKALDVSVNDLPDQNRRDSQYVDSAAGSPKQSAMEAESKVLVQGLNSLPKIYHPALLSERVKIPTAFISGNNDPYLKAVQMTGGLFGKKNTKFVEHSGGHHLPKEGSQLKNTVAAAQWAIRQSQLIVNQH